MELRSESTDRHQLLRASFARDVGVSYTRRFAGFLSVCTDIIEHVCEFVTRHPAQYSDGIDKCVIKKFHHHWPAIFPIQCHDRRVAEIAPALAAMRTVRALRGA